MRSVSFGVRKFEALLLAGSFTVLANYVVRLTDSIVAGRMLGAEALAGINLASPVLTAVTFLSGMIASGMATHYSLEMGRCNRLRAREFFMQGLWSVLICGGAFALAICFGREFFLGYLGASEPVTVHARGYLTWIWPMAVIEGLELLLVSLGYADGDARTCALGYVVIFVGNLVLSVAGVKLGFGTAGCAVGSLVSGLLGVAVLSTHFLRGSNTFAPVRHFALADTWRIFFASFGDAAAYLCDGLIFLFLNKFTIVHFGSGLLPTVGVIAILWGLFEFMNGLGVAIQPIVTVYYGEGNMKSVRTVMSAALWAGLVEGLLMMAVLLLFPRQIAALCGLTDPAHIGNSVFAIRCLSAVTVPLAMAGIFNSYYMFVERPVFAAVVTFLCYFVLPVACISIGSIFGEGGVWVGLGVGSFVGLVFTSLIIVALCGVRMFPLLLPRDRDARIHVFNLWLDDRQIVDVSRRVGELPGVPMQASLLVEEVLMVVKDRARGRRLLGEVTVDLNSGVLVTLRDDGEIFDITDADLQITSLRSYLVASMMCAHDGRTNLITTGFNRNIFRFDPV